jgi:hypothetical protein
MNSFLTGLEVPNAVLVATLKSVLTADLFCNSTFWRVGVIEDFLDSHIELAGFLSAEYLPEFSDYFFLARGENTGLFVVFVLSMVKAVSS